MAASGGPGPGTFNHLWTFTRHDGRHDRKAEQAAVVRTTGTVTAVSDTSISVQPATGAVVTYKIGADTRVSLDNETALKTGQTVVVAAKQGADTASSIRLQIKK